MQRTRRYDPGVRIAASIASALCLCSALAASSAAQEEHEAAHRLVATILTRSDRGNVYCGLWRGAEGFPTQRRFAVGHTRDRTIVAGQARCVFEGLVEPRHEYAVAAFHDENGSDDLDTGAFGIPTEGTGASNDARGFMGPPQWQHARFVFPDVREHRIIIHIGY